MKTKGYLPTPKPLIDITPAQFRCTISVSCPAVFISHDSQKYVFIGTTLDPNDASLAGKVGAGESAVQLSRRLVEAALKILT